MKAWWMTDPEGFKHRVVLDGAEFFGWENLYHFAPRAERRPLLDRMLKALYTGRDIPADFIIEADHAN